MAGDSPTRRGKAHPSKEALSARLDHQEARKRHRERKCDTRRKILVGAYYLDKAKQEDTWDALVSALDAFLTRDSDRALFDLPKKSS